MTTDKPTIEARFAAFHAEYPQVYAELQRLALEAVRRGRDHLGIGMLWEVMRWNVSLNCEEGGYKLNNDFRSLFARKLIAENPELAGVFELRTRRSA